MASVLVIYGRFYLCRFLVFWQRTRPVLRLLQTSPPALLQEDQKSTASIKVIASICFSMYLEVAVKAMLENEEQFRQRLDPLRANTIG